MDLRVNGFCWLKFLLAHKACLWKLDVTLPSVTIPSLVAAGRHEIITKEILELDPADNVWTVVERRAAMHDSYDVCVVANLNPRDLFTP